MGPKSRIKLDKSIDINVLYFAGRLLQEQGNFSWVPDWLAGTLGLDVCAVGITVDKQCIVYFSGHDDSNNPDTAEISVDVLWCSQQDSLESTGTPCHIFDCPVRRKVLEKCDHRVQEITCFPMAGKKGFLMACGEGVLLNSFPVTEILKATAYLMECSLQRGHGTAKTASYFLPSEDMVQVWSEMLAGLSHDLRTPLACIKGYVTTLLREDVTWDPGAQREFLNIIVEETDHIETLINNLLDSSTFSWKGEIELKKEPVMLSRIVKKVLSDPSYRIKNHRFSVYFPRGFPLVDADPVRIEQVLRNLVDNAVKYSGENTRIVIKGEYNDEEIIISVADEGIGISDEHLNRLFEKFFRIHNGSNECQKGMGLGLPLARQILSSHGGRIWAKSKLHQGTTFYFTLPVSPQKAAPGLDCHPVVDRGSVDEA